MQKYYCCQENRRNAVLRHGTLNGIDFLEVVDSPSDPPADRQRTLIVSFLKPLAPGAFTTDNFRVSGGERILDPPVVAVELGADTSPPGELAANQVAVTVATAGDFSTYTLILERSGTGEGPPDGFDPLLSMVDFSFKVACDSDLDCAVETPCPPEELDEPEIDYLAKDYGSFRRAMLDRLALLVPEWTERSPADLGIALVELLAYVGDRLSYQQDAIATEAYLGTARRRVSVRRHARLVDYHMHDGVNARVFVRLEVNDAPGLALKREVGEVKTQFATTATGRATAIRAAGDEHEKLRSAAPLYFEPLHDVELWEAHNEMHFYTWGEEDCCLPKGATRATLIDAKPNLAPGHFLVLGEVRGAETGEASDADSTRRHPVRLTSVQVTEDPLGGQFKEPPDDSPVEITEIEWAAADALPFPLCAEVSVAWGNVVLADHGETLAEAEDLGVVPAANPVLTAAGHSGGDRCDEDDPTPTPPRYRPRLARAPVTHEVPYVPPPSARAAAVADPGAALPAIRLTESEAADPDVPSSETRDWEARRDLLNSRQGDDHFVAEIGARGEARLRFGDDTFGARPAKGSRFEAVYRVGNGKPGNVGAGAIGHVISADATLVSGSGDAAVVSRVTNPLPAAGGVDRESVDEVRRSAPRAFRRQERAVTASDYADAALRTGLDLQRAEATFRWTGSWHTVFVTVDRLGGAALDAPFERDLRAGLERFRMAGHDLEVDGARFVPLEIEMRVCLEPDYFASEVKRALLDVFSDRVLEDGSHGLFHADNFSFGEPVFLSPFYAAAQAQAGVASVEITRFRRQGDNGKGGLDSGQIDLDRLEIARLDNDPSFPDRGIFNLIVEEPA